MSKDRILLIIPPFTQTKQAKKRCIFPLGIGYLSAELEKEGFDVKILDCIVEGYNNEIRHDDGEITFGLIDDDIRKRIRQFMPDFVGVSASISRQAHNAHKVCKIAKEVNPNIQIIMGGCHASVLPNEVLKDNNVDHVVVGNGEKALVRILRGQDSGIVKGGVDINKVPWPARHLFPMEKYLKINMPTNIYSPHKRVTQIEFTRSCPFNCCFCAMAQFKGKYQKRHVSDCLAEVVFLKEKYNIEELEIKDANFVVDKKWVKEILIGIKDIGISWTSPGGIWIGGLDDELLYLMKESGCYQLTLPIESSTPRILKDIIHKPTNLESVEPIVRTCRKIGIDLHAFFVCGFPEQSRQEILNDYKFAKSMKFTSASFNIIVPLPGSDIYDKYKNILSFDMFDFRKASIPHPEMSRSELELLIRNFNRRFNSSLIYRNPLMFIKKYLGTLFRKPSFNLVRRLFNR